MATLLVTQSSPGLNGGYWRVCPWATGAGAHSWRWRPCLWLHSHPQYRQVPVPPARTFWGQGLLWEPPAELQHEHTFSRHSFLFPVSLPQGDAGPPGLSGPPGTAGPQVSEPPEHLHAPSCSAPCFTEVEQEEWPEGNQQIQVLGLIWASSSWPGPGQGDLWCLSHSSTHTAWDVLVQNLQLHPPPMRRLHRAQRDARIE